MGLKWFRARLTINRVKKKNETMPIPGFYRAISQFDSDVQLPEPSYVRETMARTSTNTTVASPQPVTFNPMAELNSNKVDNNSDVPKDIVSKPTEQWESDTEAEASFDRDLESPEEQVPKCLPRESLNLPRDFDVRASPRRIGSTSRKASFKKKKARAPVPKITNSDSENDETTETSGNPHGSETVI